MSVNEKMTAIADGVRTLSGESGKMGLDAMSEKIATANTVVDGQTDLIYQIKVALRGKAAGSGEGAKEEQEVTYPEIIENGEYYIYPDKGKVMSKAIVNVEVPERYEEGYNEGYSKGFADNEPVLEPLDVIENGEYTPSPNVDGFSSVIVNVSTEGGSSEPALIDSGSCGTNVTWELHEDGRLIISGSGKMTNYGTSSSNRSPFYWSYKNDITSVIINEGVTSIGNYVFYKCSEIKSVMLPDSIDSIGYDAFNGCTNLISVVIPNAVTIISVNAFKDCESLVSVAFGEKVSIISQAAFMGCKSLVSISFPNELETLRPSVFRDCENLISVSFPSSIKEIEASAFNGCISLKNVFYAGKKTEWEAITIGEGNDILFDDSTTLYCEYEEGGSGDSGSNEQLKAIIDGTLTELKAKDFEGVTTIKPYAFYQQALLETVNITDNVTEINSSAFAGCTSIKTLTIPYATSIENGAFSNCSNIENLILTPGTGVVTEYNYTTVQQMPWWISKNKIQNVTIGEGITRIGNHLFRQLSELTSIVIPKGVTELGSYTFYESGLKSIMIPKSVTKVGDRCFYYCNNLTDFYYEGSEEEWAAIEAETTSMLNRGTVHYNTPM